MTKIESKRYYPFELKEETEYDYGKIIDEDGRPTYAPVPVNRRLQEGYGSGVYDLPARYNAIIETCRMCKVREECNPQITLSGGFRVRGYKITDKENCLLRNPGISKEMY